MLSVKKLFSRLHLSSLLVVLILASIAVADGLPGEYYVTQRWRDLLVPYSAATNPALLTEANYVTVRGAFAPSLGNAFILYEGGATVPIGLYQSVGLSILGVSATDPIYEATYDPVTGTIIPGETELYDNHMLFMGSYAINPWNKLSAGVNLNVYSTPNFEEPIVGLAMDFGVTYRAINSSILGEHIFGLNFQNALSPNVFSRPEGEDVDWQTQAIVAKISWLGKVWDRRIDFGFDFDFKDFTSADAYGTDSIYDSTSSDYLADLAEWEFDFSGRVGFWILRMINVGGHFGAGSDGSGYWGISGGMNVPAIFAGHDMQVAYQYTTVANEQNADQHTIYFRGEFGPHREAIYAQKMARNLELGPGKLYEEAMRLYYAGKYWEAYFIFGRIITEHPDFFKNDDVKLYMGLCQENMDMREYALQSYNEMLEEFPRSPATPLANLGLLRIAYRDNNPSAMEAQYAIINQPTVTDTVKQAAAYYMGSQKMNEGQYMAAIQLFDMIMPTHSDYPFAQHSMAVAYALQNDLPSMLEHLDNTIQFVPTTQEQKEIINRSYLLLGYLYFEGGAGEGQQSMAKAVSALSKIDGNSYYNIEALLGRSWVALKSNQWEDCKLTAEKLKVATKNVIINGEADLMIGYYYLTHKQYANAVAIFERASKALHAYSPPTNAELATREDIYFKDREAYYAIASKANDLARVNQSAYVMGQIDSLTPTRIEQEKKVRSFASYKDNHDALVFFGRDLDRVIADVDYALTKSIELKRQYAPNDAAVEVQNLDAEMEKLMKELEAMDGAQTPPAQ